MSVSDEAVEELAFQWTGKRMAYAQLAPLFVERIRQIVTPALPLLTASRPSPAERDREDTKRLDFLAEKGNDWTLRGMMEMGPEGSRRIFFVGHGDRPALGHAIDTDSRVALRAAIDAARQPPRKGDL
jgi:hypothetical protein